MNNYEKNGTASEKIVREFQKNQDDYQSLKHNLINQANEKLGFDFLTNYALPSGFSLDTLGAGHFKAFCCQKIPMPYSNQQLSKFISMEKKIINKPQVFNHRGKNINGAYLIAYENSKPILFSLSIIRGTQDNEDNLDFSIKLDMCVGGKEWLSLLRLDALGASHPNYIVNGKAVDVEDVQFAKTPHIHKQTEEAQVISHGNLQYTTAEECEVQLHEKKYAKDKTFFKDCVNLVFGIIGVNPTINKAVEDDYNYNLKTPLYDGRYTYKIHNTNQIKGDGNEL